ncbi:hypothetical protein KCV01_g15343, partial [Aureobasidium melanogenum]
MRPRRLPASASSPLNGGGRMTNDGKQETSGYKEQNPKPSHGKPKVPGEGHPKEHQNMPKDKPGKQSG